LVWHPLAAALLASLPAAAEEVPSAPAGGINVVEIAILAAPLLLYSVFNLYRDKVNPNAKVGLLPACRGGPCACSCVGLRAGARAQLSDFVFIVAAVVIVLNILSILVFRVRIF
jgi:hypothetical protein